MAVDSIEAAEKLLELVGPATLTATPPEVVPFDGRTTLEWHVQGTISPDVYLKLDRVVVAPDGTKQFVQQSPVTYRLTAQVPVHIDAPEPGPEIPDKPTRSGTQPSARTAVATVSRGWTYMVTKTLAERAVPLNTDACIETVITEDELTEEISAAFEELGDFGTDLVVVVDSRPDGLHIRLLYGTTTSGLDIKIRLDATISIWRTADGRARVGYKAFEPHADVSGWVEWIPPWNIDERIESAIEEAMTRLKPALLAQLQERMDELVDAFEALGFRLFQIRIRNDGIFVMACPVPRHFPIDLRPDLD